MTRWTAWISLAAFLAACLLANASRADDPPNVLLLLTDDQGWGDVRSHGNPLIDTPTLDHLARDGAEFERFYVSPLCAPTRAALLTGRDHLRTGVSGVSQRRDIMRAEEVTIAERLRAAGYATACFGKWHNGSHWPETPRGQGFDEFLGFLGGTCHDYFDPLLRHNDDVVPCEGYITDVLTDAAIDFIANHEDQRFFCYVAYCTPHVPCQLPDRLFEKYKARGLDDFNAAIHGMVENADTNIARLLDALAEHDVADNTIVVFLSDNGPNGDRYNGGMKGRKGHVDEGGVRVPCYVVWPGKVRAGMKIPQIAAHVDLTPTLAELCDAPEVDGARPLTGRSLVPLLLEKGDAWPDRLLYSKTDGRDGPTSADNGAARSQRYRLVRKKGRYALYDMVADPGQQRDIANDEPETLNEMRTAYEAWFQDARQRAVDRGPIPIGYGDEHETALIAADGQWTEGLHFPNGPGWSTDWIEPWDTDWITDWKSTDDRIWWDLDSAVEGRYRVLVRYALPRENVGTVLRLSVDGQAACETTLDTPYDQGVRLRDDRVATSRRTMRTFTEKPIGVIDLPRGDVRLTLEAIKIPGPAACELRGIRLERTDAAAP